MIDDKPAKRRGRARQRWASLSAEIDQRHASHKSRARVYDPKALVLGRDQAGAPVFLPERPRLEHAHVIGTTGGGKSKFLEYCIRQDIANGSGVCVIDPHGEHPASLYRSLLSWLHEKRYSDRRTIHLLDPNSPSHTIGFNPLARPDPETDLSVVAGVALEAFSRAWGGEDTATKPTIERVLTATFTALAELGLTLVEAQFLLDRKDRHGLRSLAISKVTDRYTRDELQRLHELSLDERRRHDFDLEVVGPINRIARFVRPPTIRAMVGQTGRGLDFREAMDEGHIILGNLSGGSRVYERDADLLGRLLTRALFFHAKRRRAPHRPFFVYLDECHRYLSGDLENILAEVRKFGCAVVASHQWLAQMTVESDNMLAAVRNATNVKVIFRIKDPEEAAELAHAVVPLDLEMPVTNLVKPTVVGHKITTLRSSGTAEQHARSRTESVSRSTSVSESSTFSETSAETDATGFSTGRSNASNSTDSTASSSMAGSVAATSRGTFDGFSLTPPSPNLLPNPPVILGASEGLSEGQSSASHTSQGVSIGSASGRSIGRSESASSSRAVTRGSSSSESVGRTESYGGSSGSAVTVASSRTRGQAEAFESLYEHLPSAVHSKDNALYMAAQTLRNLPTGKAFLNYVGASGMTALLLTVPRVSEHPLPEKAFAELREHLHSRSEAATPIAEAARLVSEREQMLLDLMRTAAEVEEPASFRTKPPPAAAGRGMTRPSLKRQVSSR